MAFPLGALVPGLTRALTSYQSGKFQGQQQARTDALAEQDRQRQARQDLLAQQLIQAQLGNYQSLAGERQQQQQQLSAQRQATTKAAQQLRVLPNLDPRLAALPDEDLVSALRAQAIQREPTTSFVAAGTTPEGEALVLNSRTGQITRSGQSRSMGGGLGGGVNEQKAHLGAINAVDALTKAEQLLQRDPEADVMPSASAAMEGLTGVPLVGRMASGIVESQRQQRMTPSQQEFQSYMDQFAHNAVGLLPGSRQSMVLFNNLRQSYVPSAGQSPQAREAKRRQRLELLRRLQAMSQGQPVPLNDLPGFENFDSGTPNAAPGSPAPAAPQQRVGGRSLRAGVADPQRFFQP